MSSLKSICVFCGSSSGARPEYIESGHLLADAMHARGLSLVYGGAHVGIMGAIANRLLELGGEVYGVIPHSLVNLEVAHEGLSELIVVDTMHERKAKMADLADGFIALPGGLGTLEELFEVLTWSQLDFHDKPCGLFNVADFYGKLMEFLDYATAEAFMRQEHRDLLLTDNTADGLLDQMLSYLPSITTPKHLIES